MSGFTEILRFLPNDQYQAAIGASSPSQVNPFATVNDLAGIITLYTGDGSIGSLRTVTVSNNLLFKDSGGVDSAVEILSSGIVNIGQRALNSIGSAGAISIGQDAVVAALDTTAVGREASANGAGSTAVGYRASTVGTSNVAISGGGAAGVAAGAGQRNVVIGSDGSSVTGSNGISIGRIATVGGTGGIAIGNNPVTVGSNSTAIGSLASAGATDAVAIARSSSAAFQDTIAIGRQASTGALDSVAIGLLAFATGGVTVGRVSTGTAQSVVIGNNVTSVNSRNTLVGDSVSVSGGGQDVVAIGSSATGFQRGVSIGRSSEVTGITGVAVGYLSDASSNAVGIGGGSAGAQATADSSVAIGQNTVSSAVSATVIGERSSATSTQTVAIGTVCVASNVAAMAMGRRVDATGLSSIAMGSSQNNANKMTNATANSFGVGFGVINPHILLASSTDQYINSSGKLFLGDGSSVAGEGAPNNIPTNYEKLAVIGNIEAIGSGNGFVAEADDGNRVLMQLVNVSPGVYAWDTGTVLP